MKKDKDRQGIMGGKHQTHEMIKVRLKLPKPVV